MGSIATRPNRRRLHQQAQRTFITAVPAVTLRSKSGGIVGGDGG